MALILGFDFGGTKLAAGVVDLARGRVLRGAHCPTPPGARQSLAAMSALGSDLLGQNLPDQVRGIGVSFGGPVRPDQRTVHASHHVSGWEAFPLAETLEGRFGLPAVVANDADAGALGEYYYGAGQGVRCLLYLTASTGIGGGIVLDGAIHRGERAWAGEIGHMVVQPEGPPCPCGRRGCLEALASGGSIARRMAESMAEGAPGCHAPAPPTARLVAEAAAAGDAAASQVWNDAMRWLGIGIANAANLLNPGRVVIGGGLSQAGDLLFAPVRAAFACHALDPETEVAQAALGEAANLLGAAALLG